MGVAGMKCLLSSGALSAAAAATVGPKAKWRNRLTTVIALVLTVWLCASTQLSVYRNINGPVYLSSLWRPSGAAPRVIPDNATCSEILGVDKVALMFLTRGPMHHERTWRVWLEAAAGLLPRQAVLTAQEAACGDQTWAQMMAACAPSALSRHQVLGPSETAPVQHLFNIYVHALPNFTGYEPGSVFEGKLLADRVDTVWGTISLVTAERMLLEEALKDPSNKQFLLISDSDIPLYDPLTFYQQLMHEDKSRTKACKTGPLSEYRWNRFMGIYGVHHQLWRKSSQWFGLMRKHAEAVMQDKNVYNAFRRFCIAWNNRTKVECYSDEHYFPTLLATLGRENETYCDGNGVASANWTIQGPHPHHYTAEEVSYKRVVELRSLIADKDLQPQLCVGEPSIKDAQNMFVPFELASDSNQQTTCKSLAGAYDRWARYRHQLRGACPLTARKFPLGTEDAVYALADSLSYGGNSPSSTEAARLRAAAMEGQPAPRKQNRKQN